MPLEVESAGDNFVSITSPKTGETWEIDFYDLSWALERCDRRFVSEASSEFSWETYTSPEYIQALKEELAHAGLPGISTTQAYSIREGFLEAKEQQKKSTESAPKSQRSTESTPTDSPLGRDLDFGATFPESRPAEESNPASSMDSTPKESTTSS